MEVLDKRIKIIVFFFLGLLNFFVKNKILNAYCYLNSNFIFYNFLKLLLLLD